MIETKLPKLDTYYHAVPLSGYEIVKPKRNDCEKRFQAILSSYGSFYDKTLLDFGCANGFFGFRFLQYGGKRVDGVEINEKQRNFINELANINNLNFKVSQELNGVSDYDIGLFLDLYNHGDCHKYLNPIIERCETLFVSPSGNGNSHSGPLKEVLKKSFKSVEKILCGYENRSLFKCEEKK